MNKEGVPIKRIFPPYESKEVTQRKYRDMLRLLAGVFDNIDAEHRPTALDFQGLPPEADEDTYLKWIKKETGISRKNILDNKNSPESQKSYELLNFAYQQAKHFLRHTLKYKPSELYREPQSLNSSKDVFDLLEKTKRTAGLSQAVVYCRLVKTTLATFETFRNDAKLLEDITQKFESALVSPIEPEKNKNTPLVSLNENKGEKEFYAKDKYKIEGTIETRAKKIPAIILKFITRADSNAETAMKDGIASRITIKEANATELLPILCEWLTKEMGVGFVKIGNQNYFSKKKSKEVKEYLTKTLSAKNFIFSDTKPDSTSMGNFQALKITGTIQVSEKSENLKDAKTLSPFARKFEIQIVHPENENEKGRNNHNIFEVVKLVTARTRLDGGCPEDVFEQYVADAHVKSGESQRERIPVTSIKKYLLEGSEAPLVKMPRGNGRFLYIAHPVYSRWYQLGLLDETLFEDIRNAKK